MKVQKRLAYLILVTILIFVSNGSSARAQDPPTPFANCRLGVGGDRVDAKFLTRRIWYIEASRSRLLDSIASLPDVSRSAEQTKPQVGTAEIVGRHRRI
jgi:hypothetical protein